jgi:hypothetical protein
MLLELLIGCTLAAGKPPSSPPPDPDAASRELLLYLAEFGGDDDAVDPLDLDHADLPRRDTQPKPAEPTSPDHPPNSDHAAPHPEPPPR